MVLTKNQEKILKNMPIIRSEIRKSKDGKYIIHRNITTTIRPSAYYEAVLANNDIKVMEDSDLRDFLQNVADL